MLPSLFVLPIGTIFAIDDIHNAVVCSARTNMKLVLGDAVGEYRLRAGDYDEIETYPSIKHIELEWGGFDRLIEMKLMSLWPVYFKSTDMIMKSSDVNV